MAAPASQAPEPTGGQTAAAPATAPYPCLEADLPAAPDPDGQVRTWACTRCGNCCRWPGYVRVATVEIDRIAAYLGLPVADFLARYTRLTDDRRSLSLTEQEDGACIFFQTPAACRINPVKPQQCRDFPNRWNFPGWRQHCRAEPA